MNLHHNQYESKHLALCNMLQGLPRKIKRGEFHLRLQIAKRNGCSMSKSIRTRISPHRASRTCNSSIKRKSYLDISEVRFSLFQEPVGSWFSHQAPHHPTLFECFFAYSCCKVHCTLIQQNQTLKLSTTLQLEE